MINSCYGPRKQSKEIFIKGFTSNSVIRSPFHGGRRHFAAHNFPEDALDWSVAKFVLHTALTRQQKSGAPKGTRKSPRWGSAKAHIEDHGKAMPARAEFVGGARSLRLAYFPFCTMQIDAARFSSF